MKGACRSWRPLGAIALCLLTAGCYPYELRHENQWNSREQIWMSEASQVKLRAAQSRVFDTGDRRRVLEALVATLQDLNFTVEVLDEELGILSGKKFVAIERPQTFYDPLYHIYDDQSLIPLSATYHSWAPFWHRDDLVRLTVTVRPRGAAQLVVRASAQFYLQAVEDPAMYQSFFATLQKSLFLEGQNDVQG